MSNKPINERIEGLKKKLATKKPGSKGFERIVSRIESLELKSAIYHASISATNENGVEIEVLAEVPSNA